MVDDGLGVCLARDMMLIDVIVEDTRDEGIPKIDKLFPIACVERSLVISESSWPAEMTSRSALRALLLMAYVSSLTVVEPIDVEIELLPLMEYMTTQGYMYDLFVLINILIGNSLFLVSSAGDVCQC